MLALLGLVAAQCESGRLLETVEIPRYTPGCCDDDSSYLWSEDLSEALRQRMRGSYVTVAPGSQPDVEFPTSAYLIANMMTLGLRDHYLDADHAALNLGSTNVTDFASGDVIDLASAFDDELVGSVGWCEGQSYLLNLTFQVQAYSDGAPAGCAKYSTKVVFVETCTGHANCNTATCNDCTLLAVSAAMYNYVHLSYTTYPAGYPVDEPHSGAVNYSIGSNRNLGVYNNYAHGNGAAVYRIYANECNFPPSAPPPPPTTAMCALGYWPLYLEDAEARALSPTNATHTHEFYGTVYFMPDAFVGAMHAEGNGNCPWHATSLPPNSPPLPPALPPPGDPPSPPLPPFPPPPYQMPVELQVLLITTIPAALVICIVVAWIWWCLYYGSPKGRQNNARENKEGNRRFFKLDAGVQ